MRWCAGVRARRPKRSPSTASPDRAGSVRRRTRRSTSRGNRSRSEPPENLSDPPRKLQAPAAGLPDAEGMFTFPRITHRRRRPDVGSLLLVPAFTHGHPRRLAELAPHTDRLRLPPGRTLVQAGATARELIVVLAGEAAVLHPDGTRTVLRPGAEIGGHEL